MAATRLGNVYLDMPAVVYLNGFISADNGAGLNALGVKFANDRVMVCKGSSRSKMPGWIVEMNGGFRELSIDRMRREWASPLRVLCNFTLAEYSVTLPREITVGELYSRVRGIKDIHPEAPLAADLRRFLKEFPDGQVITRDMLAKWPL